MVRRAVHTWCLAMHSGYQCGHQGACCSADWEIDVDPPIVEAVQTGRIIPLRSTPLPFAPSGPPDVVWRPARTSDHVCGFRVAHRCSLQIAGGETMLPTACRHFPRVYLQDGRGRLLTLSHYCPTAAALLLEDTPLSVTEAAAPLALDGEVEGLDARRVLPPLLRPGMLSDIDSYAAWELSVVLAFETVDSVGRALEHIDTVTEQIRTWRPGEGGLRERIHQGFAAPCGSIAPGGLSRGFELARRLTGPHPHMQTAEDLSSRWLAISDSAGQTVQRPLARYMAACAFGNWIAYRGHGFRSIVEWLRACYDIARLQIVRETDAHGALSRDALIAAFRAADFLVVHTIDSLAFGRAAAALE